MSQQQKAVERARKAFHTGRTKPLEYRITQLKNLQRLFVERQKEIADALKKDLNKVHRQRTVTPEDKSFALGIQFMLFRVLAFLPAPVLYGSAIDSTCILWGKKCNKNTSCRYYHLDFFRQRYLGLQIFFVFGGLVFFILSFVVMKRADSARRKTLDQVKSNGTCANQDKRDLKSFLTS